VSSLDRGSAGGGAPAKFRLDRAEGKVFGVCAGLANSMNVDPMIIRLVFVAGTIFGFGSFVLIYLAIALLAD
jgi:phage shock protein C